MNNSGNWNLTDVDSAQYIKQLGDRLFDCIQVNETPNGFVIVQAVVDLECYCSADIEEIAAMYCYSPDELPEDSLLAEMIFEVESYEATISTAIYPTFEEASKAVEEIVQSA